MFRVVWQPSAEQELALIWTLTEDRSRVAQAAARVDEMLSKTPISVGESREGGMRIMFRSPLALDYHVNESMQIVTVLRVRWYDTGSDDEAQ
ncbi:MAG: type II toxin-antitoxin system RelE/ParE family toxin [Planctomycetes bacterium]|nr:type II toxin-antitoxin system RelE/ParE family toxin [Planctomycetota bacterium]